MPYPAFSPTDEQRRMVRAMAGYGVPQDDIATVVRCSSRTLRKHFRAELDVAEIEANKWIDCQPPFRESHYLDGFPWPDGKFRFKPDWPNVPFRSPYKSGPIADMPRLPDYWTSIEVTDEKHPFRLSTSPARGFLNSTFNETPTSLAQESRPTVMIPLIRPCRAPSPTRGEGRFDRRLSMRFVMWRSFRTVRRGPRTSSACPAIRRRGRSSRPSSASGGRRRRGVCPAGRSCGRRR